MLKKKYKNHLVAGLTGGIASGKSTIAAFFKELGAQVVDADGIARQVVLPGSPVLQAITMRFGAQILLPNGSLNRAKLGEIIFNDKQAQADLNAITHPAILAAMQKQTKELAQKGAKIIIWDVPLLFETGFNAYVNVSILADTREDLQLQRLMQRDGLSEAAAKKRIAAQMALHQKRELATIIIHNNESLAELKKKTSLVYRQLIKQIED